MERATEIEATSPGEATHLSNPHDYVSKHKAVKDGTHVDLQTNEGQIARAVMLSRLASERRGASSTAKSVDEGELSKEWDEIVEADSNQ
jgi:hypothetical protein